MRLYVRSLALLHGNVMLFVWKPVVKGAPCCEYTALPPSLLWWHVREFYAINQPANAHKLVLPDVMLLHAQPAYAVAACKG